MSTLPPTESTQPTRALWVGLAVYLLLILVPLSLKLVGRLPHTSWWWVLLALWLPWALLMLGLLWVVLVRFVKGRPPHQNKAAP